MGCRMRDAGLVSTRDKVINVVKFAFIFDSCDSPQFDCYWQFCERQ